VKKPSEKNTDKKLMIKVSLCAILFSLIPIPLYYALYLVSGWGYKNRQELKDECDFCKTW
jgi:hypothetical protein